MTQAQRTSGEQHYTIPDGAWTRGGPKPLEIRIEWKDGALDHISTDSKRFTPSGLAEMCRLMREHQKA